jgi:hypothetical protein
VADDDIKPSLARRVPGARTFAGPPQLELIESIADTAERAIDPSADGPLCVAQVGFERAGLALRGIDGESPLGRSADYAFLEYVIGVASGIE